MLEKLFIIVPLVCIIFQITFKSINISALNLHAYDGITTQDIIGGDIFFEVLEPEELEYTYRLRMAKNFGVPFSNSFKRKRFALVPTNPRHACSRIRNANDIYGNIALIERGECSFLSKALMIEKIGGIAAIVTDTDNTSVESEYYIEMVHDNTSRDTNIPVGYLLGKNGLMIKTTLDKLNRNFAIIQVPVNLTFVPPQLINHPPWLRW